VGILQANIMSNKPQIQELSDDELGLVTGARNVTVNVYYITINETKISILFAPVYVFGTITNANVNSNNMYMQNSGLLHY